MSPISAEGSRWVARIQRTAGARRLPELLLSAATLTLDLVIWGGHDQTRLQGTVPPVVVAATGLVAFGLLLLRRRHPWVAYTAVWCYTVLWASLLPAYQPVTGLLVVVYSIARRESARATVIALAALIVPWSIDIFNACRKIGFTWPNLLTVGALWCSFAAVVTVAGRIGYREQRVVELREAMQAAEAALAVQQEQLRLARELHDIVAHSVSAIMFTAAALRTRPAGAEPVPERPALDRGLAIIEQTSTNAMQELGQLLRVLRAEAGHESQESKPGMEELPELLEATRMGGVQVLWEERGVRGRNPDVGHLVYRVVQEGLANAMKHGGDGARATVEVAWDTAQVMVSVINDVRVAASRGHSAGLGLQGLRERLDAVGGHLYAGATTDGRFRLTVDIPTL